MELTTTDHGDVIEIHLSGELKDGRVWTRHSETISQALAGKTSPTVAVNMASVQAVSAPGLESLILLHRGVQAVKGQIVLVGVSRWLLKMMHISEFRRFFHVFGSIESWRKWKEKQAAKSAEGASAGDGSDPEPSV